MPSSVSLARCVLLTLALSDGALSLAFAQGRTRERTLIAVTALRVAIVSFVAIKARSPGQGLHAIIAVAMLTLAVVLWRSNELVQRIAIEPDTPRPRLIGLLVLQLAFALVHWLGYIAAIGTGRGTGVSALNMESARAAEQMDGRNELVTQPDDEQSESDTDEDDLIDPDQSHRSFIVQQGALLRSRSVSGPITARLAASRSYGALRSGHPSSPQAA